MRFLTVAAFLAFAASSQASEDDLYGALLDVGSIGAKAFRQANPSWDGRGVVIAVLDTGVDIGAKGLETTSTGEPKVIEARDFTGEAVVECEEARAEARGEQTFFMNRTGSVAYKGKELRPPVFLGFLEEKAFKDAATQDLNGNNKGDDRFAVLVAKDEQGEWAAYIDTDGNGIVTDDDKYYSYSKTRRALRLAGFDPGLGFSPMAMAIHIEASEAGAKRVEFHIPTGSHGTHVAGIAAGFRLNGVEGRDGVAPGAQIMSLKIGDNRLAGGATVTESMKRALEFVGRWAREHNRPVVVNMSYGIGAELEGEADIEKFIDRFVEENPQVVVVVSAGNGGPGLSTVGCPASARGAISVGAMVAPESARDLIGAEARVFQVFHFSARGGEMAKPDVVAPGIAASAVPGWERADLFRGTSMAAPQVSGAVALLLSALQQSGLSNWNSGMVKQALTFSAKPIEGYTVLDIGWGLVDVGAAYRRLLLLEKDKDARWVVGYEVRIKSPTGPPGGGSAAFFRAGGFVPDALRPTTVTIKPRFVADAPAAVRSGFYRAFKLSSDKAFLRTNKGSVYFKGENEASFDIFMNKDTLNKPGLYTAVISASSGPQEIRIPVSVVIPFSLGGNGLTMSRTLEPGQVVRLFFRLPAGAETLEFSLEPSKGRYANAIVFLYDGSGRRVWIPAYQIFSEEGKKVAFSMSRADGLSSDTYELVIFTPQTARRTSAVDIKLRPYFLRSDPVRSFRLEPGKSPFAEIDVVQEGDEPFFGVVRGAVEGFEQIIVKDVSGDVLRQGFSLGPDIRAVEFEVALSVEDYARFTDIAVAIEDSQGNTVQKSGFSSRILRLRFENPQPHRRDASYTFKLIAGRTFAGGPAFRVEMRIRYLWSRGVLLTGTKEGQEKIVVYPGVKSRIRITAASALPAVPSASRWYGWVEFASEKDGAVWLRTPVQARAR